MGAQIVLLQPAVTVRVLPSGSSLTDFVAACKTNPLIQKAALYVLAAPEEIVEDRLRIKQLTFYSKALGHDRHNRTLIEQPPLYLGKIAYDVADTDFKKPLGITKIKPLHDLTRYAEEGALYLAQQGFDAVSYLRFRSLDAMQEICRIIKDEAPRYPPLAEPSVLYL